MKLKVWLLVLAASTAMPAATAHQTYLISDLYKMRQGTDNFLTLRNGTFHESGYSITRKMSRDISVVVAGVRSTPPDSEIADVDKNPSYKSTYIKVLAEKNGTGLAGVAAHPDYIALPAEMFLDYLEHEGLADAMAEFKANNKRDTIRERYTKHAKGIFQVGDKLTDDFKHVLNYKAELFIDKNPGLLKVGDDVTFRALFEGKPLANQLVFISHATKQFDSNAAVPEQSLYSIRTDSTGSGKFKITKKDKWYIQMIHMAKVSDADADYESNWSTINFEVL